MRRFHPSPRMDIPISMEIYNKLLSASCSHGWEKEDWEITAEAIEEYLRRHDPESFPMAPTKGYQWKSLFLPDGTVLRTVFGGKNHHCIVENDQILYNGQAVSPSAFVNAVGGVRRNAWRSTWVLLPENKHWVLADALRTREKRPRRRKAIPAMTQTEATQSADPSPTADVAAAAPLPDPVQLVATRRPQEPPAQIAIQGDDAHNAHDDHGGLPPGPQARPPSMLSPPACTCCADRRAGGNDPTPHWLREQLQLLLNRMFALDDQHHAARACRLHPGDPS